MAQQFTNQDRATALPQQASPAPAPATGAFTAPRLELPRFQFRPLQLPTTPAQHQAPTHAPQPQPQPQPHYAPQPQPQQYASVPAPPPATHAPAPMLAPTWQASATAPAAPMMVAVSAPVAAPVAAQRPTTMTPAAMAMASSTANATTVSWTPGPSEPERGLLQRITAVHMGVLMMLVMAMLVMTSGPAAMSVKPSRLPAAPTVAGGGADPSTGVPTPARAGSVATDAAAKAGTDATKSSAKAKVTRPAKAKGQAARSKLMRGIPSPAASANLAIAGGGRAPAGQTGTVQMSGIPSPAAAAALGPQTLPFRPSDGVTLPRTDGERDAHAVDSYYGATTLPMEEPAAPVLTPAGAAASAERHVTMQQLTNGSATPPAPNVGQVWAF